MADLKPVYKAETVKAAEISGKELEGLVGYGRRNFMVYMGIQNASKKWTMPLPLSCM